jgi:alpha-amylase
MPLVCMYFQIHQPFRLRKYTVFESDPSYFDNGMNAQIVRRIAERCYVPMNKLLLEQVQTHHGKFKVTLSVTGTALEQFESYAPEVLHGLHALADTRCVEFLGETFHHSLAALRSPAEFRDQVELHRRMIKRLFGQVPTVFRNTELIYSNAIGALAAQMGFKGVLAEGWEPAMNNRSAAFLYRAVGTTTPLHLILRNHRHSDAISYQFADSRSPEFPITEDKFANLVGQIGGRLCNLFMDYETFGEHQSAETGIFDFMRALPAKLLATGNAFTTPGTLLADDTVETAGELDVPSPISWADASRDLGAWMGNAMQSNALEELYKLETRVKAKGDAKLLAEWRKLTTSDHFYYMSTKDGKDGGVHSYFRPYDSPYDAYINFMNVLENLRGRIG